MFNRKNGWKLQSGNDSLFLPSSIYWAIKWRIAFIVVHPLSSRSYILKDNRHQTRLVLWGLVKLVFVNRHFVN